MAQQWACRTCNTNRQAIHEVLHAVPMPSAVCIISAKSSVPTGQKVYYKPTVSAPTTPAEFAMTKGSNTSWIMQEHNDNDCRMMLASNNHLSSQNQMTTEEEDSSGTSDTLTLTEELDELNEMTNEGRVAVNGHEDSLTFMESVNIQR